MTIVFKGGTAGGTADIGWFGRIDGVGGVREGNWGMGVAMGVTVFWERRVSGSEDKKMGGIPWNKRRLTIFEARRESVSIFSVT
jgi:hypothetical protein